MGLAEDWNVVAADAEAGIRADSVMLKVSRIFELKTSRITIAPSNSTTSSPFGSSISTRERLGS